MYLSRARVCRTGVVGCYRIYPDVAIGLDVICLSCHVHCFFSCLAWKLQLLKERSRRVKHDVRRMRHGYNSLGWLRRYEDALALKRQLAGISFNRSVTILIILPASLEHKPDIVKLGHEHQHGPVRLHQMTRHHTHVARSSISLNG